MPPDRMPRLLYWLLLAAMLFSGLATVGGLDGKTGGRLGLAAAVLIGEVGLAAWAVVMLVRTRARR